jgi:hypothetical protein
MVADEDFWDDLLAHLKQGVLLPVIGPQLSTMTSGGRTKTVSRLIGERLADRYKLSIDWPEDDGLDPAIRAYIGAHGRDKAERLYRVVNDTLADLAPDTSEPLRQLARITDFRLFISTTFDSMLAHALDQERFPEESRTRQLAFSPNQSTAEQLKNTRPPDPDEAVVFKLFGEASSTPQYALHEEDLLEWLHALLSETARLPEWLRFRLKESPLLFVGCDISDWLGRLLVRLVSAGRLSLLNKQCFIVGTGLARQRALTEFLSTYCGTTRAQIVEATPGDFVAEFFDRWTKRTPVTGRGQAPAAAAVPHGNIFISYAREDIDAVRRLADAIGELGGDVWLDERRLEPGDRWANEILTSIRRDVRLFVPVVSKNTEARDEGYVFREWGEALERAKGIPRRRFVVPVTVDADYDGNPSRYQQVPNEFMDFHFGRAPGGRPDELLIKSLQQEIRAMRQKGAV